MSRVGRVNDNLNLSRAIGDMSYKRNLLQQPKDQIISAEPDVCRYVCAATGVIRIEIFTP